jgi:hypothetical protein
MKKVMFSILMFVMVFMAASQNAHARCLENMKQARVNLFRDANDPAWSSIAYLDRGASTPGMIGADDVNFWRVQDCNA